MVRPAVKREAVAYLREHFQMSERRACTVLAADRKMIRYASRRPPETELRGKLRDLANERRRFGYCRLFILLRREGEPSGINRIYRLYREEGLGVRKRKGRKRSIGVQAPRPGNRSLRGSRTTTPRGRIRRWPMRRPQLTPRSSPQQAGTRRPSGAPHANLLLNPPNRA